MRPVRPEASVMSEVRRLLKSMEIFHFRMNSGAFQDSYGHRVRFGEKGCADILALPHTHDGFAITPLWIECKSSIGKQSKAQQIFQQTVESYGHTYLVVRSAHEVYQWLMANDARGRV